MNIYRVRHLFDASAEVANKQRFRYAIACTLSSCVAGILLRFLHIDEHILLFFVVSSGVAVYYSYGSSLLSQTIMVLIGSLLISLTAFFSIFIAPYFGWALLYFAIITLLAFYYSSLNTGWMFIAKLGLVILSFSITQTSHNNLSEALALAASIFAGGIIAALINTLIYIIAVKKPWKYLWQKWHLELLKTLNSFSSDNADYSAEPLLTQLIKSKPQLFVTHPNMTLLIERITYALVKFSRFVQKHPYILDEFHDAFQQLFLSTNQGVKTKEIEPIEKAFNAYREHMATLSQEGFFRALPTSIRKEYAECFFLVEKLYEDLIEYIKKNLQQQNTCENYGKPNSDWCVLKTTFKRHRPFNNEKKLTNYSKVAIRAGITLSVTYVITYLMQIHYAAWVMLSATLVLQIRQGDTIKKALDRVGGHFVGAIATAGLGYFVWHYFWTPFFWVPVLVLSSSYYFLKNYFVFAILLMPIIVYIYATFSPLDFAHFAYVSFVFTRFIDVALGSLLAMLGGILIFRNVGIQPFSTASDIIFRKFKKYLCLLKFSDKAADQTNLIDTENELLQQLERNQQLYQSLSFQPECYIRNKSRNKKLMLFQTRMYENLRALSRRLHIATHIADEKKLSQQVNYFLGLLSENLDIHTEDPLIRRPKKTSMLYLELEKSIEHTFARYDQKEINLRQLLYFLGIVNGIKSIQELITKLNYRSQHN